MMVGIVCTLTFFVHWAKQGGNYLYETKLYKRPLQVFWLRLQTLGKLSHYSPYLPAH